MDDNKGLHESLHFGRIQALPHSLNQYCKFTKFKSVLQIY